MNQVVSVIEGGIAVDLPDRDWHPKEGGIAAARRYRRYPGMRHGYLCTRWNVGNREHVDTPDQFLVQDGCLALFNGLFVGLPGCFPRFGDSSKVTIPDFRG